MRLSDLNLKDIHVRRLLGFAALAGFATHAAVLLGRNETPHLMWICHIASIAVGAGMILGRSFPNAVGVLWLCLGNGMWVLYLAGGGEFNPTSILTHVVSLAIGLAGIRRLGLPRNAWVAALTGLFVLVAATRVLTPERENVNVAFRVHEAWANVFSSHPWDLAILGTTAGALFLGAEKLLQKVFAIGGGELNNSANQRR